VKKVHACTREWIRNQEKKKMKRSDFVGLSHVIILTSFHVRMAFN
jgi:hypothetical protein